MKQLYAVFDRKAKAYGPIMGYAHDAVAVRDFSTACQDEQSNLCRFPEDFELHDVGIFEDSDSAEPVHGSAPRVVITASAVKAMNAQGPKLAKEA